MVLRMMALAAAVAAVPLAASATTVTTFGNQTSIFFTNENSDQNIGNFDLAVEPVGVNALFTANNVSGSLTFGVFSSNGAPAANGSVDINMVRDNETFMGTFDGQPLTFEGVGGDFVATFGTAFDDASDMAEFYLQFSGFDAGDQFQVNVSAVPLPASILMLMGALGGMAFLGRRRLT
jgi:hypothetical protein